ncbi:MAG: 5-formyltetrahydrofolate cyclo-ligase [Evtepia sp.]
MDKKQLRHVLRQKAERISLLERERSDLALFTRFLTLVHPNETILLFFGVGTEPKTGFLIAKLLAQKIRVCLPRCLPDHQMEARQIQDLGQLVTGAYGIPEPNTDCPIVPPGDLDLILVPALSCDLLGGRLGQGGGFYDRFLPKTRALTVCLCRDALLQEHIPLESHDCKVALVLTERKEGGSPPPSPENR